MGRPICSLLPFKTVCIVAWIEHHTITFNEPLKNSTNIIIHASRGLLACVGELKLLNRSSVRLACELQKIKTRKINSHYGLERCSEAQEIKKEHYIIRDHTSHLFLFESLDMYIPLAFSGWALMKCLIHNGHPLILMHKWPNSHLQK